MLKKLHHVAYWCQDAQRTKEFYTKVIGLKFVMGLLPPEGHRAHGAAADHTHVFFELGDGSYIAFFDLPSARPTGADTGIPVWVNHIAFEVEDEAALMDGKRRLEEAGYSVRGPTDHGFCLSIYFSDPDGNQLEMAVRTDGGGMREEMRRTAEKNLAEWNARKQKLQKPADAEPVLID